MIELEDQETNNNDIQTRDRSLSMRRKKMSDKIRLYDIINLPIDGTFNPIVASINFEIKRKFSIRKFIKCMLCGLFLPFVIFFQTFVFWCYSEKDSKDNKGHFWYWKMYPYQYKYNDFHYAIFLDFLD